MGHEHSSLNEVSPQKENFVLSGRVLYLTKDPLLIRRQINGKNLYDVPTSELLTGVSTDEIIPNNVCLRYTGHENDLLSNNVLTGLRGNIIKPNEVLNGGFQVLVAGTSFGRGSSRYHAPIALVESGFNMIVANPERIFQENCVNIGLYSLSPDDHLFAKLVLNKKITLDELRENLTPVSADIMKAGSLVNYFQKLNDGTFNYPESKTLSRPMTIIEKIIASRTHRTNSDIGVEFVKPGEEIIAKPDKYYGYELQTTVVRRALSDTFGENVSIKHPEKAFLFNDHTALIQNTQAAQTQQQEQKLFADKYGIINFENDKGGSVAICHTKMLEDEALPGQIILGNDSHTCTLGAVNTLAIGKGAADLAGALAFDQMVIKVPETIRINIVGELKKGVTMKDFVLQLGASNDLKNRGEASGKVLEFGGEALQRIDFDEQIKLTNMAVELQAFTGIIEPNSRMLGYLKKRGLTSDEITSQMITSDSDAQYFKAITINLSSVEPTVATPGDTQNGVPLSEVSKQNIKVHKAYIGSCTHGTPEDLRQAAEVARGRKIQPGVELYIQASSVNNLEQAINAGHIKDLIDAGAKLLTIGCGACMNAGPGSTQEGEVGIFATNRNFSGRTGKGETYLSSPAVVIASAIRGFICGPEDLDTNFYNV